MNFQQAGEHFRYLRGRTDLNETTRTKQLETQIVQLKTNNPKANVYLPHIIQNFQNSGLDSQDIKYVVKSASFPQQIQNVFEGDYVEIYAGYLLKANGQNTNLGHTYVDDILACVFPEDKQTNFGFSIFFGFSDNYDMMLTGYEIAEQFNEQVQKQVQEWYELYIDGYTYSGPDPGTTYQTYVYELVINVLRNSKFFYEPLTGKLALQLTVDNGLASNFQFASGTGLVQNLSNPTQDLLYPNGTFDGGDVVFSSEFLSFELQIYPGRQLTESRQKRIAQMFGMNTQYATFEQNVLSSAYTTITSAQKIIDADSWNTDVRGIKPTEFTFYTTGLLDAKPIKQLQVYSTLKTNSWLQYGTKSSIIYVHNFEKGLQQENTVHDVGDFQFSSKENIQGIRNGFEIQIKDEYGEFPVFFGDYMIEIAFMI